MLNRTANLLGALGLAVADRIENVALDVMNRAGETPAALIVIGSGAGPSNDQLKRILGLSHPGTVRLVDRLAADGLVERRAGKDKRSVALFLTEKGTAACDDLLAGRLATIAQLLSPLDEQEQDVFAALLHKLLAAIPDSDLDRCHLCRMCDNSVCTDCPIPADFRQEMAT
ncbi:Transcriptional regulator, MarR family [Candidatus Phaeomarinobacter ectocarpi]|uniref:Transcriptional regulator, MarR family n=1 Tax=Candidatus Phaeomarinibacter ectocarpi TaxID=1458461 RepID=X5M8M5_9HYPH|nr:MarR family transcriptional regulator [Candidatus Phaeomarinobacter ectocarpi]CDO59683.1 Transcriptional regulator, MarR family [Candidatus Phaeomarinobacter ectocarpi]